LKINNEEPKIPPLDKLYFSVFSFTAEAVEDIFISEFKGSTFHGGFGKAFKRLVCINPQEKLCERCIVNKNCSYYRVFDSRIDEETGTLLKITSTAPRPYVLEPPNTIQRKFGKGELFHFNLILIGWALEYLPYFIIVFERLGEIYGIGKKINEKRGRFKLLNVRNAGKTIYAGDNKILLLPFEKYTAGGLPPAENPVKIKLNFVTPARLEVQHKPQMLDQRSGFTTFILRLYGRLYRLQEIYCSDPASPFSQEEIEILSREIKTVHASLEWYDLERFKKIYSEEEITGIHASGKKQKMQYGGFIGEVIFEGNLRPFIDMIRLGEHLHIGKYYTFGLGKYEILSME